MIQKPYGTNDILPGYTEKWQYIESVARETAALYGFGEIRFPTIEYTELFQRGVGTGGSVTGYGGGVARKVKLLELERTDMRGLFVPTHGTAL